MELILKKIDDESKYMLGILICIILALGFIFISFLSEKVSGGLGLNVTVITQMDIGTVPPEILYLDINDQALSISLTANATKLVYCTGLLRDYNGDLDLNATTGEFFFNNSSGAIDDNNYHYTNNSCVIYHNFSTYRGVSDDQFHALANCSFQVEYYAYPGTWNCTMFVNDTINWNATKTQNVTINELLAVGLPGEINYGIVNATYMSDEQIVNVTNFGNVRINLSISGYARTQYDNFSMNCSLGSIKNISIQHEKYNFTVSNLGTKTLGETVGVYQNLSGIATIKQYGLLPRYNDAENEAWNETYWRMYVPLGVAGTCQGTILFGATKATGT